MNSNYLILTDAIQHRKLFCSSTSFNSHLCGVGQMQKFRAKEKKLYFGFVDWEKAFDRLPRGDKMGNA